MPLPEGWRAFIESLKPLRANEAESLPGARFVLD
jgi:hypothetical protein